MKSQLKQVIFLAIIGIFCTFFVLFSPFGKKSPSEVGSLDSLSTGESLAQEGTGNIPRLIDTPSIPLDFSGEQSFSLWIYSPLFSSGLEHSLLDFSLSSNLVLDIQKGLHFPEGSSGSHFDLALLPYDQFNATDFHALQFQEDLAPHFLPIFSDLFEEKVSFFPFSVDPVFFFSTHKFSEGFDLTALYAYADTWKKRNLYEVFLFGPFDHLTLYPYNLILTLFLKDSIHFNDVGVFTKFFEMHGLNGLDEFKTLSLLRSSPTYCKNSPLFCLLQRGILQTHYGRYSEDIQFQKALEKVQLVASYSRYLYPHVYLGYPVRGYGFALPKDAKNHLLAQRFLLHYLDFAFGEKYPQLWGTTFPAFSKWFDEGCKQDRLCPYLGELSLSSIKQKEVQQLIKDRLLQKVLEKKYKPDLYLEKALLYLK